MFKKILLLGMLVVALIGLPLTIFFSNQKQTTRTDASTGTTILSLIPQPGTASSIQKNVGDTFPIELMVNPGTHAVSLLRVQIKYDPAKLELVASDRFTPTGKFDFIQPPVPGNGVLSFVISIGSNPNNAIYSATSAGTLNFKAIDETNGTPTIISFSDATQVFSLSSNDQSSENVLSIANPAQITINGSSTDETPTATPTTSSGPTATPTITPTPDPSIPTSSPSASSLSLTVLLHSIGNSGDNVNPTLHSLSNKNPNQKPRTFTVSLYNASTEQFVASYPASLNYVAEQGNFQGTLSLDGSLPEGDYIIKIKAKNFLKRRVPGFKSITFGKQITLPTVTLVAGDANDDNKTDIFDYNLLIGCYSDFLPPISCDDSKKLQTDFNDDGFVNQTEINLFLREITVQNGD